MTEPAFSPDPASRRARLRAARLCLLASSGVASGGLDSGDLLASVDAALAGGVDIVQVREKTLPDREIAARAREILVLCRAHGALLIVNDRIGVAAAIGADGVHVGQDDAPVAHARAVLGEGALVGVSTHDDRELDGALADGADYVGVGSVFATTTKRNAVAVGSPESLAPLALRAERAAVAAFAIGGIDVARAPAVAAAGFRRIAVSAGILRARDPRAAAAALRAALTLPAT